MPDTKYPVKPSLRASPHKSLSRHSVSRPIEPSSVSPKTRTPRICVRGILYNRRSTCHHRDGGNRAISRIIATTQNSNSVIEHYFFFIRESSILLRSLSSDHRFSRCHLERHTIEISRLKMSMCQMNVIAFSHFVAGASKARKSQRRGAAASEFHDASWRHRSPAVGLESG